MCSSSTREPINHVKRAPCNGMVTYITSKADWYHLYRSSSSTGRFQKANLHRKKILNDFERLWKTLKDFERHKFNTVWVRSRLCCCLYQLGASIVESMGSKTKCLSSQGLPIAKLNQSTNMQNVEGFKIQKSYFQLDWLSSCLTT